KQPVQKAKVYINDTYLKEIIFRKKGEYTLQIPSDLLDYGSNLISFKWAYPRIPVNTKRKNSPKLSACFYRLCFLEKDNKSKPEKSNHKISISAYENLPTVLVPTGGILEYYVDLPDKPVFKFGLFTKSKSKEKSKAHIAVYNEKMDKSIYSFKNIPSHQPENYELKLKKYSNKTVKIVFLNSIENTPDSSVVWINPTIHSPSGKPWPKLWRTGKGLPAISFPENQQNRPPKSHVFIYLIDTLRADHLSCYGYERKTSPFIDEFSKDGVLFKYCFSNASWTRPAVGSILTGTYPNRHRAEDRWEPISDDVLMLSEVLKSNGYSTLYLTTNVNVNAYFNFNRGHDFYQSLPNKSSKNLNSAFFKTIKNRQGVLDKPVFSYLHSMDPHLHYFPAKQFIQLKTINEEEATLGHKDVIKFKKNNGKLSEEDLDTIISLYDAEILQNDFYFGKFIEFLKEEDLYKNSLIILVSDHGEQFDEHGHLFHGHSIYNEEIHVPLIIKFPNGEFSGLRTDQLVSQVDIFPTILDYIGIAVSQKADGLSLLSLLETDGFERTIFIKENYLGFNLIGFVTSPEKKKQIIQYKDRSYSDVLNSEFFDLEKDFYERDNLFKEKTLFFDKSIKFRVDSLLEDMRRFSFEKKENVDYEKLNPETIRALKALGYIN
ncbi:sulfatase-like hydrolase/transferase, partial [Acidobacteriota bacterium]